MNKLLTFFLCIYLLFDFSIKWYLTDIDMINLSAPESEAIWLLGLVRDFGFSGFLFFLVVFSFYKYKLRQARVWSVIFSLCVVFGYASFCAYMAYLASKVPEIAGMMQKKKPNLIEQYNNFLNTNDAELQELIRITDLIAGSIFEDSGVIVEVVNIDGEKVAYEPTEKNLKRRRDALQADALIKHSHSSLVSATWFNLCLGVVSILVGLFSTNLVRTFRYIVGRYSKV